MTSLKSQIISNSSVTLVARITDNLGNNLLQSTTTSISVSVYDLVEETVTFTDGQIVADVVFNTLQLDGRWNQDIIGYNLAIQLAGSCFPCPNGNTTYRVEVTINPTAGDPFVVLWDLYATEVL
jgi:hypothetical protein